MKLHEDKAAFRVLLSEINRQTGYRMDILEKDYYVTLILHELADKQSQGLKAYFKGGTALYKALRNIRRFSEDVDLSVDTRECSRSKSDKMLRQATKEYQSLTRDPSQGQTERSVVIAVYTYTPEMEYDSEDVLQRFGKLKIEATSFTISEPYEPLEIAPMIYEYAMPDQKKILEQTYDVKPFNILTMTLERIFIDKLFAAEAYSRTATIPHRAFDAAKHIYDLCILVDHPRIRTFLQSHDDMERILKIRMTEEENRLDGIPGVRLDDFSFFLDSMENPLIVQAYQTMQNQYVSQKKDRISIETVINQLKKLSNLLRPI